MIRSACAVLLVSAAVPARAAEPRPASFALVIGENDAHGGGQAALRYADDDAVLYYRLFASLGVEARLLADLDENTRRVHPDALAGARSPTRAELAGAVRSLATAVAEARAAGRPTALYVVYAGHGDLEGGQARLSLADGGLTGRQIVEQVIDVAGADRTHLIVDACFSYLLVEPRGPGGRRRPLAGFTRQGGIPERADLGLLLSTSSARESHEWEGFQAGVFSYEVRSGMHGAADADRDGMVSYREIAAFVDRANAGISNERFRPQVFARPPAGGGVLIELAGVRRLDIGRAQASHYRVEDAQGVRLVELHSSPAQDVSLVLPASGTVYVHDVVIDRELVISPGVEKVELGALLAAAPRVRARGAAHEAFSRIFSLPFDLEVALRFEDPPPPMAPAVAAPDDEEPNATPRPVESVARPRRSAWTALAIAGAAGGLGAASSLAALRVQSNADGGSSADAAEDNGTIRRLNIAAAVLYGVAAVAGGTAAVLFLWPDEVRPAAAVSPGGGSVSVEVSF